MLGRAAGQVLGASIDDLLLPAGALLIAHQQGLLGTNKSKKKEMSNRIDPRLLLQANLRQRSINPYANPMMPNTMNQIYGGFL